ncbi:MAG: YidC/Oxa1 family membrane protein insertase [bacterium]|nr:YidC/Oxa1 family membrane protein insertase [bacterium]
MNIFTTILIQPLANGLILFYKVLGNNLGLAIIGFSVFLRFALNPLTKPYMKSMKKIKEAEPQLNKLKEKYKDDKKGLVKAQADFYKGKGINPGAGCLPYLLQIVVLIALFNVFTKVLVPGGGVEMVNKYLYNPVKFKEGEIIRTNFLYLNLSKPDVFKIPSLPVPIPGPVLILAAALQLLSSMVMAPSLTIEQKMAAKTKKKEDDMQTAMQKSTMYTFPLFTIIFGMKFSSGLALYWAVFSAFQLIQQYQTSGWGGLTPWVEKLKWKKSIK